MRSIQDMRRQGPPPEVAAVLPALLAGEVPAGVETLRSGFVFRVGEAVVKFYKRSGRFQERLRKPRALRAIHAYRRLLPVLSPQPLYWDRLDHPLFGSVLVYGFVEGKTLVELLRTREPAPVAALPQLFADLHSVGVLHADLHANNLVWSEAGWCVLDLDGVRHGLHSLRRRAITERIWARLMYDFEGDPALEQIYRDFLGLAGEPWPADASWARIQEGHERALQRRALGATARRS